MLIILPIVIGVIIFFGVKMLKDKE